MKGYSAGYEHGYNTGYGEAQKEQCEQGMQHGGSYAESKIFDDTPKSLTGASIHAYANEHKTQMQIGCIYIQKARLLAFL